MLLPALPVVILWLALPLAAALLFRSSSLPTLTAALTLAAGLLGAIVINLPAGMMASTNGNPLPALTDNALNLGHQPDLTALAMWLFGAGGLVLFAGGLAKGAKAGLLRGLGAFGLLLLYMAVGLRVARAFLPVFLDADASTRQQPMYDIVSSAERTAAVGFLAGSVLILVLVVLTLLSRLKRG